MNAKALLLALLCSSPLQAFEITGTVPGGLFGNSIATDGKTIVVGAWGENNVTGAAYIYRLTGGQWVSVARLAGDGHEHDYFGSAVAVEGAYIAVGASQCSRESTGPGMVYVFDRFGGFIKRLTASDGGIGDCYGVSVTFGGGLLYVGAHLAEDSSTGPLGKVYAYQLESWEERARLGAGDGRSFDLFGAAIDAQGDTLVVGSMGNQAVYVFRGLAQTAKLSAGEPGDFFGCSVAIDNLVAVGAWGADGARGAVYVYQQLAGTWINTETIAPSGLAPYDRFGYRVAASRPHILAGAYGHGSSVGDVLGAVYLLSGRAGDVKIERFIVRDGKPGDGLGSSVAAGGSVYAAGASWSGAGDEGAVYLVTEKAGRL